MAIMSILRDNCSSSRAAGTRATQLVDPPSLCQEGVRGSHRHQRQRHCYQHQRHRHHHQDHDPCCRKSQIICQEGERDRYHHPHQRHPHHHVARQQEVGLGTRLHVATGQLQIQFSIFIILLINIDLYRST